MDQVEINIDEILNEMDPLGLALFREAQQKVVNSKLRQEIARLMTEEKVD